MPAAARVGAAGVKDAAESLRLKTASATDLAAERVHVGTEVARRKVKRGLGEGEAKEDDEEARRAKLLTAAGVAVGAAVLGGLYAYDVYLERKGGGAGKGAGKKGGGLPPPASATSAGGRF